MLYNTLKERLHFEWDFVTQKWEFMKYKSFNVDI